MNEAEGIAKAFHETYERLAPGHGWETQERSRVEWADVPDENRALMVAVADELLHRQVIEAGAPSAPGSRWERAVVSIDAVDEEAGRVAQRFLDEGMLWLANRVLHPFGWAVGVSVKNDTGEVVGLLVQRTTDPDGIVVPSTDEIEGRRRFLRGMFARGKGQPPESTAHGVANRCPECSFELWEKNGERGCGNPRCPRYKRFPREVEMGTEQKADYVDLYEDEAGEWRWRALAGNREVIADSGEGYQSREHAEEMARGLFPDAEFQASSAEQDGGEE